MSHEVMVPVALIAVMPVLLSAIPFPVVPGTVSVTVTTRPPAVAVTGTPALALRVIALARLTAVSVKTPSAKKFAPVLDPFAPPVRVPPDQAKPAGGVPPRAMLLPAAPAVTALAVTAAPFALAVTPTAPRLRLI